MQEQRAALVAELAGLTLAYESEVEPRDAAWAHTWQAFAARANDQYFGRVRRLQHTQDVLAAWGKRDSGAFPISPTATVPLAVKKVQAEDANHIPAFLPPPPPLPVGTVNHIGEFEVDEDHEAPPPPPAGASTYSPVHAVVSTLPRVLSR